MFKRLRKWWNSGYDIRIQTEQELRSGGLIGDWAAAVSRLEDKR